ncbi:DUF6551 family protein [Bosea sp. BK604]|uniref:DUF6551 family protein n=1 Tax=Bosea sp. BK604 TaxID=2512180 RepID=UPI001047A25F|nr:DUF6551 family protein [Bosea sp. BK604]TCR68268.1 hypothetical protein EV560_10295 [Bosea sp. BK604]
MTARPIKPLSLPDVPRAVVGTPPRLMRIHPSELWVDGLYQRDLSSKSLKLIEKLVRFWDWSRFSIPVVTNVDGAWHVIDGQHTAIAALSHGGIGEIDVMVVESSAVGERAEAFLGHNRDRIAVTTGELFFAAAASGDDDVLTALSVCERAGATVLRNPSPGRPFKPGEIIAVAALMKLVKRRSAMQARVVIECLVKARLAPVSAEMINAVDSVLYGPLYGDVEPANVLDAILKFGNAIAPKAIELSLAKKLPKARALAILIYQHTKKGKRPVADATHPAQSNGEPIVFN